ncbi:MAG: CDP-diacylglycerol--glycerol-3-phosphate 3-phosphatidyltransferase [Clostridia bacterium]|nr:CDP-diacylglycerol--glycerol-3-phosphate 3-phosphatidyltransferase [Clostridia bacterium]
MKTKPKQQKRLIPDVITPNKITVARICMIPLMILFFYLPFEGARITAAAIFALAAATDFLDGYIARKYNQVSTMGKFLDPIADKVLVLAGFILLLSNTDFMTTYVWMEAVFGIFVCLIVARELIVSGFREIAAEKKVVLAAGMLGKIKTVAQDIAIFFLLFSIDFLYYINYTAGTVFFIIGFVIFCVAVLLTVVSGVEYIVTNKQVLKNSTK